MAAHINLDKDLTLLAQAAASWSSATAAASRSTRARPWRATRRFSAWRCSTSAPAELSVDPRRDRRRPGERHAEAGRRPRDAAGRRAARARGGARARRARQDRAGCLIERYAGRASQARHEMENAMKMRSLILAAVAIVALAASAAAQNVTKYVRYQRRATRRPTASSKATRSASSRDRSSRTPSRPAGRGSWPR